MTARTAVRAWRTGAMLFALSGMGSGLANMGLGLPASLAVASLAAVQPAMAQTTAGVVSREVVQPTGTARLNEALARLASQPQDIDALLDASNAALQLGDTDAAIGFLTRADSVSPGNPRVKALIGSALVRNENPYDAIGYFDQAEAAGADLAGLAADRGLAFDLVGDQTSAQAFYRLAMARAPGEEVVRRYALSLAVSGDRRMADSVLSPLIQRQDPAAWRTRTFILAISGQEDEAISVAGAMMPKSLAEGIAPYLRYMPRLTRAQQIAAATFGKFPRAADIGRDDPRAARFAQAAPRQVAGAPAPSAPAPATALAAATPKSKAKSRRSELPTAAAPAPVAASVQVAAVGPKAAPKAGAPVSAPVPVLAPAPVPQPSAAPQAAQASVRVVGTPPAPAAVRSMVVGPVLDEAPVSATSSTASAAPVVAAGGRATGSVVAASAPTAVPASTPAPAAAKPAAAPNNEKPFDFRTAFGDFRPPVEDTASAGAVDITRLPSQRPRVAEVKPVAPRAERGARPDGPTDVSRKASVGSDVVPAKGGDKVVAKNKAVELPPAKGKVAVKGEIPSKTAKEEPGSKSAKDKLALDKGGKAAKDVKTAKDAKDAKDTKGAKGKAKEPANPSRIWVQLSTGGNRGALPADWRRLVKEAPQALRGRKAYVTAWRNNFRLLTGPFPTDAAARAFINDLRKADVGAFSWESAEGQAVEILPLER